MATNSEGKICAEIERVCGSEHAYFCCEVDPTTNAVKWRLDLYGKARGYQRLAFTTYAEAVAELERFKRETEVGEKKSRETLELKRVPDSGFYRLDYEYFHDTHGLLWRNAGRIGERPLRLYYCEPSGEASGPIWGDVVRVLVDGVETPFVRREYM